MPRGLALVIVANAMLRIAGGASGVLVGIYLADLANQGFAIDAALVGLLSSMSFGAELAGAIPMGVIADAVAPRTLMSAGALVATFAIALFGLTRDVRVFFVTRVRTDPAMVTPQTFKAVLRKYYIRTSVRARREFHL